MAKYSTGSGGGGDDGGACELCGREDASLSRANVAGADLLVCSDCAPHDDSARGGGRGGRGGSGSGGGGGGGGGSRGEDEPNRKKRAAQNVAKAMDAGTGDSRRWEEEGTDYEEDRLPYLVDDYGETVTEARQDAGMSVDDLAAELGVDAEQVHAVEEGRAARAGVGGSVVRAIEKELDVVLVDE
ncbi:transcriptional regulator [Halobaculum sp. CBA1158]|uniref:helix-turn-helix domain-containing protein n=1 Tax=Halobaculum sp. CBA1158 TaxID=2904243 RepID=UPI001F396A6B|nr:transcriptional regulator [Halobaculum sp. CBA1158]UIO98593.1 transcriptional regulator [Halobaculum sp. CBA1158]